MVVAVVVVTAPSTLVVIVIQGVTTSPEVHVSKCSKENLCASWPYLCSCLGIQRYDDKNMKVGGHDAERVNESSACERRKYGV